LEFSKFPNDRQKRLLASLKKSKIAAAANLFFFAKMLILLKLSAFGVSVCITFSENPCFKGDEASQWNKPIFNPSPHDNLLTDLHKNWQA